MGITIEFNGKGIDEKGILKDIDKSLFFNTVGEEYFDHLRKRLQTSVIEVDACYFRPTEVDMLIGDATKAKERLRWEPKYSLDALIEEMVISDIQLFKKEKYLKKGGFTTLNYFE